MSTLRIQLAKARARDLSPHERKQLVVDLLNDLQLELFGEGAVATKAAHQVLTDSLNQDSWDWLKARAAEGRLA